MAVMLVGDCHGAFEAVLEAGQDAETIIMLGDQTPARPLEEELGPLAARTWFLLGNHDTDQPGYLECHQPMMPRHLHCRRIQAAGMWIAGLSGVFRGSVLGPRRDESLAEVLWQRPGTTRKAMGIKEASTIFPEDLARMAKMRAHVLVTHEAPESHRQGFKVIGDLARTMGARLLVHGHKHERYEAEIEGGIKVVGLGIPGQGAKGKEPGLAWLGELL